MVDQAIEAITKKKLQERNAKVDSDYFAAMRLRERLDFVNMLYRRDALDKAQAEGKKIVRAKVPDRNIHFKTRLAAE